MRLPENLTLILASASPRRRELLREAGYLFEVLPPEHVDETFLLGREAPEEYVQRLARAKCAEIAARFRGADQGRLIVACDTIAECGGEVLGKPRDRADARRMLQKLSGQQHRVLSGICLWRLPEGRMETRLASSLLEMDPLSSSQLEEYLASEQWIGKAGAFGYQDRTGWLRVIAGSESNVVGLPLDLFTALLAEITT
ncbi:MAG TPA: nucleoside triphosphate pyrophosphatase [Pirellulales bacterium]|jgi:septum formation protein|nr:nucleoside triphosphate pyrophosphatase [Pirellulales bacterium]